jgi:hypothetical protein
MLLTPAVVTSRSWNWRGGARAIGWVPPLLLVCAGCATATGLSNLHESECTAHCDSGGAADATDAGSPSGDDGSLDDSSDATPSDAPVAVDSPEEAGDGSDGSPEIDAPKDSPGDGPSLKDASDGAPVQPGGLLYYFPLAGDANDYSGHNHNANVVNNVSFAAGHTGKANSAAVFNGTSSYMSAPGTALPTGAAARTLTAWINPSVSQFGVVYWGKNNCNPSGSMFGLGTGVDKTGTTPGTFWGGCDDVGANSGIIPMGKWTFLAAAFTAPDQLRLFVNGTGTTYTLGSALNTPATMFWVGAETTTDSAASGQISAYFKGSIDSIRVYDHALTDADVGVVMALP